MENTPYKPISFFQAYLKENLAPRIKLIGVQRPFYSVLKYCLFFKILKFRPTLLTDVGSLLTDFQKSKLSLKKISKGTNLDQLDLI